MASKSDIRKSLGSNYIAVDPGYQMAGRPEGKSAEDASKSESASRTENTSKSEITSTNDESAKSDTAKAGDPAGTGEHATEMTNAGSTSKTGGNAENSPGSRDAAGQNSAEPNATEPNATEPNAAEPSAAEPSAAEPSAGQSSTAPNGRSGQNEENHVAHKRKTPLTLGPGQKYKIEGYAEQRPLTIVDNTSTQAPVFHRAQMRVSGSMCYACLLEFRERLQQIYGIEMVRVEKGDEVSISAYTTGLSNWANAILFYDSNKLDLRDLRAFIRTCGYYPYKVSDKSVRSVPPESQKKI